MGSGGVGGAFREGCDLVEVDGRNFDRHLDFLPFVVELDGELGQFVEASLQGFRCLVELEPQLW
ncbi:hypothetical protein [Pseudofrankia sp. DC12]|uniref:hypothetical protein n=1 Tax=Pseudofrankia sp. DC12 TaxID=683315 RepID=UPI0005F7EE05|nr:hypothetical protein [Pseudofrankia sp. DC12]